jgi:hypothetical protein
MFDKICIIKPIVTNNISNEKFLLCKHFSFDIRHEKLLKNIKSIRNNLNSRDYYVYNPTNNNLSLDKFIKYIINIFKLSKHHDTVDKIIHNTSLNDTSLNDTSLNLLENTKKPTSLKDIIYIDKIINTINNTSYKNTLEQCIKNFDYKSQYEKEQKRVFEKYNILKNKVSPYINIKDKNIPLFIRISP